MVRAEYLKMESFLYSLLLFSELSSADRVSSERWRRKDICADGNKVLRPMARVIKQLCS